MKKTLAAIMLLSVTTIAQAIVLSPGEALQNATLQLPATAMGTRLHTLSIKQQATPAYTLEDDGMATVYVFANPQGTPGFIIAAADDQALPLLGYSADATFDPANIPPQMKWLLQSYSRSVKAISNQGRINALSIYRTYSGTDTDTGTGTGGGTGGGTGTGTDTPRTDIAPICQTTWNQDNPYWLYTPTLDGSHAYTGCWATAVAQCMRVHRWPVTGTGTLSYSFTYRGTSFTDSFDFAATTFDWDNMLDSYSGSYTDAQSNAVATLMHACGVASRMKYGTWLSGGSSASQTDGALGLIENLGYDKGLRSLQRCWYTTNEWETMVYQELAAGRPVPYGGQSGSIGHEFVCDGYQADTNLFHINWGWGGMSDGYFALPDLNPAEQGAGGTSSGDGYKDNQSAYFGLRAPGDNPTAEVTPIMAVDNLRTLDEEYVRTSSKEVPFSGRYFNASYYPIDNLTLGFKIETNSTTKYVTAREVSSLAAGGGYSSLSITATNFPIGRSILTPMYKIGSSGWLPYVFDRTKCAGYLIVDATSNKLTITKPDAPDAPIDTQMKVELQGYDPADDPMYAGRTYNFRYKFTAEYPDHAWFLLAITDINFARKAHIFQEVTFTEPGVQEISVPLTIPDTLAPDEYQIFLSREDASGGFVILGQTLIWRNVVELPTAIDGIGIDTPAGSKGYYDMLGRKLSNPARGTIVIEHDNATGKSRKLLR